MIQKVNEAQVLFLWENIMKVVIKMDILCVRIILQYWYPVRQLCAMDWEVSLTFYPPPFNLTLLDVAKK